MIVAPAYNRVTMKVDQHYTGGEAVRLSFRSEHSVMATIVVMDDPDAMEVLATGLRISAARLRNTRQGIAP